MTRLELFLLYVDKVDRSLLSSRLNQLLNFLTPAQQTATLNTMKNDLVTVFQNDNTNRTLYKANFDAGVDAQVAANNTTITEVNGVS